MYDLITLEIKVKYADSATEPDINGSKLRLGWWIMSAEATGVFVKASSYAASTDVINHPGLQA